MNMQAQKESWFPWLIKSWHKPHKFLKKSYVLTQITQLSSKMIEQGNISW